MIFVNTTLEVALQRNELRDRVLPQSIVSQSHKEVNRNIGAFQGLFGSSNFMVVDNNEQKTEDQAKKRFKMLVKQGLGKFVKAPIKSKKALSWIRKQKILRGKVMLISFDEINRSNSTPRGWICSRPKRFRRRN